MQRPSPFRLVPWPSSKPVAASQNSAVRVRQEEQLPDQRQGLKRWFIVWSGASPSPKRLITYSKLIHIITDSTAWLLGKLKLYGSAASRIETMNEAGTVDALTHSRDFGQEHAQVLILWGQSTHIRLIDIYIYIWYIHIYICIYHIHIYIYIIYIYHIYISYSYIYIIYIYISYIYIYIYIIYIYHIYIYIYHIYISYIHITYIYIR